MKGYFYQEGLAAYGIEVIDQEGLAAYGIEVIVPKDTDLVLLNSLRLHCEEALHYAYQGERSAGKLIFK